MGMAILAGRDDTQPKDKGYLVISIRNPNINRLGTIVKERRRCSLALSARIVRPEYMRTLFRAISSVCSCTTRFYSKQEIKAMDRASQLKIVYVNGGIDILLVRSAANVLHQRAYVFVAIQRTHVDSDRMT